MNKCKSQLFLLEAIRLNGKRKEREIFLQRESKKYPSNLTRLSSRDLNYISPETQIRQDLKVCNWKSEISRTQTFFHLILPDQIFRAMRFSNFSFYLLFFIAVHSGSFASVFISLKEKVEKHQQDKAYPKKQREICTVLCENLHDRWKA